jgi:ArsR family transcriptional regulator
MLNQKKLMQGVTLHMNNTEQSELKLYAEKFKALSDPLRLCIILNLKDGEKCVCELCDNLEMQQSKISYHLKILVDVGLIKRRYDKTWSYYSLKEDVVSWVAEECCEFIKLRMR